mmetsp:Transcript_69727/g.110616  ORF Transcript_69727/g.110616 Transcript_69727/m.110616 type:complete len:109 (+) Transcript_69727:608-934(+)
MSRGTAFMHGISGLDAVELQPSANGWHECANGFPLTCMYSTLSPSNSLSMSVGWKNTLIKQSFACSLLGSKGAMIEELAMQPGLSQVSDVFIDFSTQEISRRGLWASG